MAHFAKIDENNIVQEVIVVSNNDCGNLSFPDSEVIGQSFLHSIGLIGNWKQTSYNTLDGKYYTQVDRKFVYDPSLQYKAFRKNFAGIGFTYNPSLDGFIPPKLYQSWTLDTETCTWIPPIDKPRPADNWIWDESIENWKEITLGSPEPIIE